MQRHQRTASILSFIAMGLGQLYNRQFVKGILLLCVEIMGGYYFVLRLPHALWGLFTLGDVSAHLVKVQTNKQIIKK